MSKFLKERAIAYLSNKAESEYNSALMSFELLLEKNTGIGDHSVGDYEKNLDEALQKLCDAQDKLDTIQSLEDMYL